MAAVAGEATAAIPRTNRLACGRGGNGRVEGRAHGTSPTDCPGAIAQELSAIPTIAPIASAFRQSDESIELPSGPAYVVATTAQ